MVQCRRFIPPNRSGGTNPLPSGVQSDWWDFGGSGVKSSDTAPRSRSGFRGFTPPLIPIPPVQAILGVKNGLRAVFTGVSAGFGVSERFTMFVRCLARKNDVPPVHNDTRCSIMIVSFEPTKIGFFTGNTNNDGFSNWYNRID